MLSRALAGTPQFFASTSRGVCRVQSEINVVLPSENFPSSKTSRNSHPSGPNPCMECGTPVGKYHRSLGPTSEAKPFPSLSTAVIRAVPVSISAHSPASCQCSSRMPPAVSRIFTPAISFEIGKSSTVTCRDHPPS